MPEAGTIKSNLKPVTVSLDEELPTPNVEIVYDDRAEQQQTIEAERELFEENYRRAHERRWTGQERWQGAKNEEMRLVNIMHPHDFIRKLQAAGVNASIEPAVVWVWAPDDHTGMLLLKSKVRSPARLWLNAEAVYVKGTQDKNAGRIGVSAWVQEGNKLPVTKTITSLQWDCGPEWSLMRFDQWNVPTNERFRGWRTALLQLILQGIVSEAEAERAFGPVVENEASELYRETLQMHRQRRN